MRDLVVLVPDHCLSFYFQHVSSTVYFILSKILYLKIRSNVSQQNKMCRRKEYLTALPCSIAYLQPYQKSAWAPTTFYMVCFRWFDSLFLTASTVTGIILRLS